MSPEPEATAGDVGSQVLRFVQADIARVHQEQGAKSLCTALAETCPALVAQDLVEDGGRQVLFAGLSVHDGTCRSDEVQ